MSQYLLRKFKSDNVSLEAAIGAHVESIKRIGARSSSYRLRTYKSDGHSKTILHPPAPRAKTGEDTYIEQAIKA